MRIKTVARSNHLTLCLQWGRRYNILVTNFEAFTKGLSDPGFTTVLLIVTAWEMIWKAIGMWKAARNNQRNWFVFILLFNTIGILPIIYLRFFQKKQ